MKNQDEVIVAMVKELDDIIVKWKTDPGYNNGLGSLPANKSLIKIIADIRNVANRYDKDNKAYYSFIHSQESP